MEGGKYSLLTTHKLNRPTRYLLMKKRTNPHQFVVLDRFLKRFIKSPSSESKKTPLETKKKQETKDKDATLEEYEEEEECLNTNLLEEYENLRSTLERTINNHNNVSPMAMSHFNVIKLVDIHVDMITKWDEITGIMRTHQVTTSEPLVFQWSTVMTELYPGTTEEFDSKEEWSNCCQHESIMLYVNLAFCLLMCSKYGNEVIDRETFVNKAMLSINKAISLQKKWKEDEKCLKPPSLSLNAMELYKKIIVIRYFLLKLKDKETFAEGERNVDGISLQTHKDLCTLNNTLHKRYSELLELLNGWKQKYGDSNKNISLDIQKIKEEVMKHIVYAYIHKSNCYTHKSQNVDNIQKFTITAWHLLKTTLVKHISGASPLTHEVNKVLTQVETQMSVCSIQKPSRIVEQSNVKMEDIDIESEKKIINIETFKKSFDDFSLSFNVDC
jgi:hypothetical protein